MKGKLNYIMVLVALLCGFGLAVLCGAVIDFLDTTISPHERLVKQWGLFENAEGALTIPLPENGLLVEVQHDPKKKNLQSIDIMKEGVGSIFEYQTAGEYGSPSAHYGGGKLDHGMLWTDLDCDGRFDRRFDFARKVMEILVEDRWIKGVRGAESSVTTSEGAFKFNTNIGRWERK